MSSNNTKKQKQIYLMRHLTIRAVFKFQQKKNSKKIIEIQIMYSQKIHIRERETKND